LIIIRALGKKTSHNFSGIAEGEDFQHKSSIEERMLSFAPISYGSTSVTLWQYLVGNNIFYFRSIFTNPCRVAKYKFPLSSKVIVEM